MAWIRNAWNNFKTQPEIWFFYGFLATSMLSVRKVIIYYPRGGTFNEYAGTYSYPSDIFLFLTLAIWIISILYNKSLYLSITAFSSSRCSTPASTQGDSSSTRLDSARLARGRWNMLKYSRGTNYIILIPLALVIWSFISITWSDSASIALYRSFKLFEFYLLYLFLDINTKCSMWNILRNSFRIIIVVGLINAIIGILQVVIQHSLGLFWLEESLISPDLPGVAKIVLGGTKYIRAYGLFPHPNILGGFLFLSLILTLAYWSLFYVKQSKPACANRCASWDSGQCKIYSAQNCFFANHNCFTWNNYGRYNRYLFAFILGIQIVAGILTFSKSAILGLFLALVYMFHPRRNVPPQKESSTWNFLRGRRGTFRETSLKHFSLSPEGLFKKAIFLLIIAGLGIYLIHPNFSSIFIQSLTERLVYINISMNMIFRNFLAGIGSGQFVLEMQNYSNSLLAPWQLQPVHNVFLLIWSELGLIGLFVFVWFIWELFRLLIGQAGVKHNKIGSEFKNVPHGTFEPTISSPVVFKALTIGFFAIALFDHYLWDIQQGQIMLWLVLGFLANTNTRLF